jgi:hypothetical protein
MTRGGYGDIVQPVLVGVPCRGEVIILDETPMIRVTQRGRLIGYFSSVHDLPAAVDLARLEIPDQRESS